MTRFRFWAAGVAVTLIAGCNSPAPQTQESRSDAARAAACRDRVDAIYAQQNRAEIYTDRSDMARDAMLSGSYVEGIPSRGLADRYQRQRELSDCLRESSAPGASSAVGSPSGAVPQ